MSSDQSPRHATEQMVNQVKQLLRDVAGGLWHAGRRHGRTLYNGDGDDDGIGYMDTRPLATLVVTIRNLLPPLIYDWEAQRTTIFEQRQRIEHLLDVLHIDRSGLAAGLNLIRQRAKGSLWIGSSRGSYTWDDADYQREAGWALEAIIESVDKILEASGNTAHAECCERRPRPEVPVVNWEWSQLHRMHNALSKIAGTGRRCGITYAAGQYGFRMPNNGTCRDLYQNARDDPEHYGAEFREQLLSKSHYCSRCIAVDALEGNDG